MNPILEWLSGGDLRSDGMADEVAEVVLKNPTLFEEVVVGIDEANNVVRARTADALEKIARVKPELLVSHLPKLIQIAAWETVPMVKMHLAMIMGHLAIYQEHVAELNECLLGLLKDQSVFTRSWVIVSLCILARKYPELQPQIVAAIASLSRDDSIAIRTRVRKALELLMNENARFPKGWVKSEFLKEL